jgi:predicted HicB family RNase H-like nuclease
MYILCTFSKFYINYGKECRRCYVRGKYCEGQKEATIKYLKNNYDELRGIRVPKGQKDVIKAHAEKKGLSLNAYINELIAAGMGDD